MFCREFKYAFCIRRSENHPSPDPLSWVWYRPSVDDFEPLLHAAFLVGKLKQDKAVGIASLCQIADAQYGEWKKGRGGKQDIAGWFLKSLQHDVMVLLNHPLTYCDIIVFMAQAQRYFLDIIAFLDYVQYIQPHIVYPPSNPLPVRSEWIGCFTADMKVCDDLFHAGVPVWLVRSNYTITPQTIIEKPMKFTFPDNIIRSMYSEPHQSTSRPFEVLYCGPAGFLHHHHTRHHYAGSVEPSAPAATQVASQSSVPSQVGKLTMQAQTRRAVQKKEHAHPKRGKISFLYHS